MTESINELINDEAVYRTAPATPGLLITSNHIVYKHSTIQKGSTPSNLESFENNPFRRNSLQVKLMSDLIRTRLGIGRQMVLVSIARLKPTRSTLFRISEF